MKFLVVLLCACAVMTLVVGRTIRARRDATDGDAAEDARACPSFAEGDMDTWDRDNVLFYWLVDKGAECRNSVTLSRIVSTGNETLAWMREQFEEYCQSTPAIKNCLAGVLATSGQCLNQSQAYHPFVQLITESYESSLDFGCSDNGERLAKIFHGLRGQNSYNSILNSCSDSLVSVFSKELINITDPSEASIRIYYSLKNLKDCLVNSIQNDDELRILLEDSYDHQIRNFKCIKPEDNTLVLCANYDKLHVTKQ